MPNLVGIGNSQVPTNAMLGGLAYENSSVLDQARSGRKNMIINGDMRICQRFAVNTANNINNSTHTYHVDRFKAYESTNGILQGEWKRDDYVEGGFQYCVQYTPATADTSLSNGQFAFISHVIELENMKHLSYGFSYAKTCTLSFYVKSNLTGTYSISVLNDGTNDRQFVSEYQINNSNTWERKTITIPGDTSGVWDANGLRISWNLASAGNRWASTTGSWFGSGTARYGTNNQVNFMSNTSYTFKLTGVQFEIGENATDFENRSYNEELTLCQRYCQAFGSKNSGDVGGRIAHGTWSHGTTARTTIHLPTPMRAIPSIHSYNAGHVLREAINWYNPSGVGISESTKTHFTAIHSFSSSSGASANDFATWGNGAGVILDAEI
tara:strand:- start:31 stop:1176 length:1146 start_codon:yes stop_codon:yes gene_type:complete